MRYALYYTPPHDHPLTLAASRWLGRDAFANRPVSQPTGYGLDAGEMAYLTASARRYGFHGTLKAPFRLAPGASEAELIDALDGYAARRCRMKGPRLVVGQIDGFMALVPESACAGLQDFADEVVREFDHFRAPPTEADFERRNPARLSNAELKNLTMWGYPHVFDTFRFHMTLTGRIGPAEVGGVHHAITAHFGDLLATPIDLSSLALFVETQPGEPFVVKSLHAFSPARPMRVA